VTYLSAPRHPNHNRAAELDLALSPLRTPSLSLMCYAYPPPRSGDGLHLATASKQTMALFDASIVHGPPPTPFPTASPRPPPRLTRTGERPSTAGSRSGPSGMDRAVPATSRTVVACRNTTPTTIRGTESPDRLQRRGGRGGGGLFNCSCSFYLMYVSSMLLWRPSMQYFVTFLCVKAGSCNNDRALHQAKKERKRY
jgi:hypothetical protein